MLFTQSLPHFSGEGFHIEGLLSEMYTLFQHTPVGEHIGCIPDIDRAFFWVFVINA